MLRPYLTLCRVTLSAFAACSAVTGFFLGPWRGASGAIVPATAVFLMACGASAMNQCQERDIDAKMERTRGRPVPSGEISVNRGAVAACALIIAGAVLLSREGATPLLLGLAALFWYNVVYTNLKKVSAFASVPGAAAGMLPPMIGWTSAGGELPDARIAVICLIFLLWQVPHFWLMHLRYPEDHARAGLPSLSGRIKAPQLARLAYVWLTAASVACLLLPLYGVARSLPAYCPLALLSLWLLWQARGLIGASGGPRASALFGSVNAYILIVMCLLTLEGMFLRPP